MNFKFRNLLMTAGALLAFTACSNDSDGVPQEPEAQLSDVSVRIEIPGAAGQAGTRGLVEDPIAEGSDKLKAQANRAIVYLMDGKTKVAESGVLTLDKGEANHTFVGVFVSGKEKVRVIAYNDGKAVKTDLDYEVYDLQPVAANESENVKAMPGIINSVYSHEDGLGAATTDASGKKIYDVKFDMNSLTARLELMGTIGFNTDLVKNINLKAITPIQFREKYTDALDKIITPQKSENPQNKLWYNFTSENEGDVINGIETGKALANHLFAEDKLAFAVGIQPTLYVCEKDKEGYIKLKYSGADKDEKYSAIYQDKADSNILYIYNKEENAFYNVTKTGEKYSIKGKVETEGFNFANIKTEDAVLQFFNMASKKTPIYDGGKIYKIQLSKLDWGGGSNNYSPDVNTGNPETPEVKDEADVIVTATVVDWTVENTEAGLD